MVRNVYFDRLPCTGDITTRFGETIPGVPGAHMGIDFGGFRLPVQLPSVGTYVSPDKWTNDGSFGLGAVFDHAGTDYYSLFAHLDELADNLRPGMTYPSGTVIGWTGFSGKVIPQGKEGAHLHWQVGTSLSWPKDPAYNIDPLPWVNVAKPPSAAEVNEAIVKRMEVQGVALGDYASVLKAHKLLTDAKLIKPIT